MSGCAAEVFGKQSIGENVTQFLAKPFSQAELAAKIRVALDARRS
jgi:CheY-like chemotaxis protein